ncbi:MAG: hypothetical protein L0099_00975 [Acidobacteria bacterium]|nr:hypothetical protein [Acidobacteriota bacterium]
MKRSLTAVLPLVIAILVWEAAFSQGRALRVIFSKGRVFNNPNAGPPPAGDVPVGGIILIDSGTCPAGYAEVATLDAQFLRGTVAANADVGTTGGSDNVTPSGTVSTPTFTGNALAGHTHTFTGNALAAHTHDYSTVIAHTHVQNINSGTTGGSNGYGKDTSTNGSEATAISTASTGSATGTTTGVGAGTPSGSNSSDSAGTPSGTVSTPTFTGNSQDNRPAFTRVIFCKKT